MRTPTTEHIYMTLFYSSAMKNFQVAIIGGGVIGSSLAWELSHYNISTIVFEQGSDVASGTSKANSGVLHSGINSPPSSLKALYCIQGNKLFRSLAGILGFLVQWRGKYVIAKNEEEVEELVRLKKVGEQNKVPGLQIIDSKSVKKKEPHVSCHSALWVPTAGIILPYECTIAFAENAVLNGVKVLLETAVKNIKRNDHGFDIVTSQGIYHSEIVVNATGLNSRTIVAMLEEPDFDIYPCRGEYLVLDKNCNNMVHSMIYPVPVKNLGVLGVHVTPTIEGNILLGPSAEFISDPYDTSTSKQMMQVLFKEAKEIIPSLPDSSIINAYSGIRCKLASKQSGGWADYRIQESTAIPGFIHLLGIESPGLTAAPAIAQEVRTMISKYISLKKKKKFMVKKRRLRRFAEMSREEQQQLIKKDERWGRIICRCETVTEAEVAEAIANPLGATTLSAIKYRCRAGMGRCQGGFCTQHIVRLLQKEAKKDIKHLNLKSPQSHLFSGNIREENHDTSTS